MDFANISKVVFRTDLPDGIVIDDLSFTSNLVGDPYVPEPAAALLLSVGAGALLSRARRRRR